jgi:hypothetical protein
MPNIFLSSFWIFNKHNPVVWESPASISTGKKGKENYSSFST